MRVGTAPVHAVLFGYGAFHLVRMHLGGGEGGGERGGGFKSPIHFHCVLHAKRGEGIQIACIIAYVLNGRPLWRLNFRFPHHTNEDILEIVISLFLVCFQPGGLLAEIFWQVKGPGILIAAGYRWFWACHIDAFRNTGTLLAVPSPSGQSKECACQKKLYSMAQCR